MLNKHIEHLLLLWPSARITYRSLLGRRPGPGRLDQLCMDLFCSDQCISSADIRGQSIDYLLRVLAVNGQQFGVGSTHDHVTEQSSVAVYPTSCRITRIQSQSEAFICPGTLTRNKTRRFQTDSHPT